MNEWKGQSRALLTKGGRAVGRDNQLGLVQGADLLGQRGWSGTSKYPAAARFTSRQKSGCSAAQASLETIPRGAGLPVRP